MPVFKVADGSTGNFTTRAIRLPVTNVIALITTTVGAGPTVTVALNGSADATNWILAPAATTAITTATTTKISKPAGDVYEFYEIVFSANTNVTIAKAYIIGTEF